MRTQTNKLIDMMDEGLISARDVADMALSYLSEDEVAEMMRMNDILDEEDADVEDDFPLSLEYDEGE
jgi:hypothetical protein